MSTFRELEPLSSEDLKTVGGTIGGYTLRGRVGSGGFKTVYLGTSPTGNEAAVGILHEEFATDDMFRRGFDLEIDAVLLVRGPFVARVTGHEPGADRPWMVSEFVNGHSLSRARAGYPFDDESVELLAAGWARALSDIHEAGVIHRDFKPGNILIHEAGFKVVDFGIAHVPHGDTVTSLTSQGRHLFTPEFSSPEQALNDEVTNASDVFSWASTVCFAASGRPPFGSGIAHRVTYRVVHEDPDVPELPAELDRVVRAAFAKDPDDRPTTGEIVASLSGRTGLTLQQTVEEAEESVASNWDPPAALFSVSHELPELSTVLFSSGESSEGEDSEPETVEPVGANGKKRQAERTQEKKRRQSWLVLVAIAALVLIGLFSDEEGDGEASEALSDAAASVEVTEPDLTVEGTETSTDGTSLPLSDGQDGNDQGFDVDASMDGTSLPPSDGQDGNDRDPGASGDESLEAPAGPGDCSVRGEGLKIGTLFTNSGGSELTLQMGANWRIAVETAVEDMNDSGGVNGFPVELVHGDDGDARSYPYDVARESADRLLCEEGVHAIIGPGYVTTAMAVLNQIVEFPAVQCSTGITNSAVGTYGDNEMYFSIIPHDILRGEALADYLLRHEQPDVSVLFRDNISRDGVGPAFTKMYERIGGRTVSSKPLNSQSLGEFTESPSSVLVILGQDVEVAELSEVFDELTFAGLTPEDLSIYSSIRLVSIEDFLGTPGAAFANALKTFNASPNPSTGSEFYGKVFNRSRDGGSVFDAHLYDCAILIGLAAEHGSWLTDTIDPKSISRSLIAPARLGEFCSSFEECVPFAQTGNPFNYEGASGPADFDYHGNLRAGIFILHEFGRDGHWIEAEEWKFIAPCSIDEEGYTYIKLVDTAVSFVMQDYLYPEDDGFGDFLDGAEVFLPGSRMAMRTALDLEECFLPDEWEMLKPVLDSFGEHLDALEELRDAVVQDPDGSHEDQLERALSSYEPIVKQSCLLSAYTGVPVPGISEYADC